MSVPTESYAGKIQRKLIKKQRVIEAASGRQKADLVLKNATYVNVFSNELLTCDIAVANGLIVGLGSYEGEVEYDMTARSSARLRRRAHPSGIQPGHAEGVRPRDAAARHDHGHHRPP